MRWDGECSRSTGAVLSLNSRAGRSRGRVGAVMCDDTMRLRVYATIVPG